MRTKKQVILVFIANEKYKLAVDMLLCLELNFTAIKNKYIQISQKTFLKNKYLDLYTGCDAIFSSTI